MDRRSFVKTCGLGAGLLASGAGFSLAAEVRARDYARVRLLGSDGRPLSAAALEPGVCHVFHYPFPATPCFLLDIGQSVEGRNGLRTEDGHAYDWPGGVGPKRSLVAFSAICAHRMAHPTRGISYIAFRPARNDDEPATGVISCCAEDSMYDPASGAAVLSGPAEQPLAAILLDYDEADDNLYAVGTLGGEMFRRFFEEFEARLAIEYPSGNAGSPIEGETVVHTLDAFSSNVVAC